jgi:hypothetical protein
VLVVFVLNEFLVNGVGLDTLSAESIKGVSNGEVAERKKKGGVEWLYLRESN